MTNPASPNRRDFLQTVAASGAGLGLLHNSKDATAADIELILKSVDITEVIREHVTLKKQGKNFVGLCPFHVEKTPSFYVDQQNQLYYCFGCGEGGNVLTFLMKQEKITFPETLKMVASRSGITL